MRFVKMHGAGNDYVYVDCFKETVKDPVALARAISDRHYGVGSDGLILIMPSSVADVRMSMFNADGSEGLMCGNGVRCVGKYAFEHGLTRNNPLTVETLAGIKTLYLNVESGIVTSAKVDMGEPGLLARDIPMAGEPGRRVVEEPLRVGDKEYFVTCLSMGNPHCVVFGGDPDSLELPQIGPLFEHHSFFPERVNTEFCQVLDRGHVKMRVWERGSGETLACGTGACACAVAAIVSGRADRIVEVQLRGGVLQVEWASDNHVYMTGPAVEVFSGDWPA